MRERCLQYIALGISKSVAALTLISRSGTPTVLKNSCKIVLQKIKIHNVINFIFKLQKKRVYEFGFAHSYASSILLYAKCDLVFFIKHLLISPILYEGSTYVN